MSTYTYKNSPDFSLKIGKKDLPTEARSNVGTIVIQEDLTAASMFTIEMRDSWDSDKSCYTWLDSDLFAVGSEVEISLGYVDVVENVMMGEIVSLEPTFGDNTVSFIVRGYDHRHRLLRGRKTRSFAQIKDSDIAKQIAREAGLKAVVTATTVTLEYVLQHNQTDLEFLQDRARRIGYEVFVEDKTLFFRERQNSKSSGITLKLEEDLVELCPRLTTMSQVSEVIVQGWSVADKKEIVSTATMGDEATTMGSTAGPKATNSIFGKATTTYVNYPILTKPEADQIALGQYNEMALTYIDGDGLSFGRPDLFPGITITIEGAGKNFSGSYYITATEHRLGNQKYRTRFWYRRNAI